MYFHYIYYIHILYIYIEIYIVYIRPTTPANALPRDDDACTIILYV